MKTQGQLDADPDLAISTLAVRLGYPEVRPGYAEQILALAGGAPQLLITFEYDPAEKDGPPFPVLLAEIEQHYASRYTLEMLSRKDVLQSSLNFRDAGVTRFVEVAWKLLPARTGQAAGFIPPAPRR